jgi:hypothetical protein
MQLIRLLEYLQALSGPREISDSFIEPNLVGEKEVRFLVILPYEGISNQINGIIRGFELAKRLGRTLVIPPIIRSQHEPDSCPEMEDWRDFIKFDRFRDHSYEDGQLDGINVPCYSFGRWRHWSNYGETTERYLKSGQKSISLRWRPLKTPVDSRILTKVLRQVPDRVIAVAQLQHVHFDNYVHATIKNVEFTTTVNVRVDVGVHWRRGDFHSACKNKDQKSCLPDISRVGEFVSSGSLWVATDDLDAARDFQAAYPKVELLSSNSSCATRYFVDLAMLTLSNYFIGNKYSTLSRLVLQLRNETKSTTW